MEGNFVLIVEENDGSNTTTSLINLNCINCVHKYVNPFNTDNGNVKYKYCLKLVLFNSNNGNEMIYYYDSEYLRDKMFDKIMSKLNVLD